MGAIAATRRTGFSKTVLSSGLQAVGIVYLHLRDLGAPKAGREAARAGRSGEMHDIYAGQLSRGGRHEGRCRNGEPPPSRLVVEPPPAV